MVFCLEDQLSSRPSSGAIPQHVSSDEALGLRRGVDALMDSWNPNNKRALSDSAVMAVRKAMNDELSKSVPDFDALNLKISNLLPVAQRAGATDLNAGVMQRVMGKLARPTGALVGTIAGGTAGYKEDGVRGALLGGAVGAIAPEIATSPTTLMAGARIANSAAPAIAATVGTGAGMQTTRDDAPPLKGAQKWAALGAAKLTDHIGRGDNSGLTTEDISGLSGTDKGKSLLIQASDLSPGSAAMKDIVKQIQALKSK